MPDFDVFSFLDIKKRNRRYHGKRKNGNFRRKHKMISNLLELNMLLKSGRQQMLSKLSSLKRPINSMIENMICMKQLTLLGAIPNMLFVRTLIL